MTSSILRVKGPEAAEFNLEEDHRNFGNIYTTSEYYMFSILFLVKDSMFQYYILYFAIALLGKYSSPIYYSFHLLDVINRSPILQNVVLATTKNIEQTGLTMLLMLVQLYILTVLAFFYFVDVNYDYGIHNYDSDWVGENNC